ncbi:MAG: hypothetical protein RLZZ597_2591 [Cyanobacteriota bacterium]|jgi:hypothetical protein
MTPRKPSPKSGSSPKHQSLPPAPAASSALGGKGHQVQVFYLAARSKTPNAPAKDALWFATYPVIPRVGDCLFRDGVYYQVERVFLYENLTASWCADIEVSFYSRR